jgi:hypothetical protein
MSAESRKAAIRKEWGLDKDYGKNTDAARFKTNYAHEDKVD